MYVCIIYYYNIIRLYVISASAHGNLAARCSLRPSDRSCDAPLQAAEWRDTQLHVLARPQPQLLAPPTTGDVQSELQHLPLLLPLLCARRRRRGGAIAIAIAG
jgi:hypothetical protein